MRECAACGSAFTWPMPTQDDTLGRYSTDWFEREYLPSYGVDPHNPSVAHLAPRHSQELKLANRFRKLNRLLDIGAGAGLFLVTARDAGWQVDGVEISEYGPRYAQEQFGIGVVHGTLETAAFPADSFDVVFLQDTIEHVSEPVGLMCEVSRVLRPGGAVILSTPNYGGIVRRTLGSQWALVSPAEHVHLFTLRGVLRLFECSGFAADRLESDIDANAQLLHGEPTLASKMLERVIRQFKARMHGRMLLYRMALGDRIDAIGVKQG